jgi:hypothetical protein
VKHNTNLNLPIGNVSWNSQLGAYYQNLNEALFHYDNNILGQFDDNGIPYIVEVNRSYYSPIYVIQYILILHDLVISGETERKISLLKCLEWCETQLEPFQDSLVFRNEANNQYSLGKGWTSAMYQGQGISAFLRAYQLFDNDEYLQIANKLFSYFRFSYGEGGVTRLDKDGNIWLEEYPTEPPSYVLNGFIYAMLGIVDLYRVTKNQAALQLFNRCLQTVVKNMRKYHVWYWSLYDQGKSQLVSLYYQKNVHIPLMWIMYELTGIIIFKDYALKWQSQLDSRWCRLLVHTMYRVRPRVLKAKKYISNNLSL